jgi:hypothetical protein
MGEITANIRPVDEGLLRSSLGVAHAGDIIDVAVDPLQYRHDSTDAIAGSGEFALRKPHEFVGGAKRLGSKNGSTSLGRSDHKCCFPDGGSSCRRRFSTTAVYRMVTSPESEARMLRSP